MAATVMGSVVSYEGKAYRFASAEIAKKFAECLNGGGTAKSCLAKYPKITAVGDGVGLKLKR